MYLANTDLGGYVPPRYNKLRTILLQQERVNVERLLEHSRLHGLQKGLLLQLMGGLILSGAHSSTL